MMTTDPEGRYTITAAGRELLDQLSLHEPKPPAEDAAPSNDTSELATPDPSASLVDIEVARASNEVDEIVAELRASERETSNPDRYEYAIRAAFEFLGFRAEKVGGSGNTDVIADAIIAKGHSFRLIVDGKTTGSGSISDHQIDWTTISDHRKKHEADFAAIAGPVFQASRLLERAMANGVILFSTADLVQMIRQHSETPLPLAAYRQLLEAGGGEANLDVLSEWVDEEDRTRDLALRIMRLLESECEVIGPMSARDLFVLLRREPDIEVSEQEIDAMLLGLAHPLVGALRPGDGGTYALATDRGSFQRRFDCLALAFVGEDRP